MLSDVQIVDEIIHIFITPSIKNCFAYCYFSWKVDLHCENDVLCKLFRKCKQGCIQNNVMNSYNYQLTSTQRAVNRISILHDQPLKQNQFCIVNLASWKFQSSWRTCYG